MYTRRYNKQVPGHPIQIDVKFLTFKGNNGAKIKRYQYTAIDDATRVRALKIYDRHTQKNAINFVNHVIEKFPFRIQQIRTDRDELYQLLSYKDDRDLHIKLAEWEQFYNFSRPHGAHLGKTPYEAMREMLL